MSEYPSIFWWEAELLYGRGRGDYYGNHLMSGWYCTSSNRGKDRGDGYGYGWGNNLPVPFDTGEKIGRTQ